MNLRGRGDTVGAWEEGRDRFDVDALLINEVLNKTLKTENNRERLRQKQY